MLVPPGTGPVRWSLTSARRNLGSVTACGLSPLVPPHTGGSSCFRRRYGRVACPSSQVPLTPRTAWRRPRT
jgi:hypothetical protein